MTTENLTKDGEVVNNTEVDNKETTKETVTPSPIEAEARAQGWVSKEEWIASGKHEDEWRSAREYKERGELFEEIHKLKEGTKQTTKAFKALVEHHKKVRETAVKEALARLKAEKKAALLNNDVEAVFELDEQIEKVRDTPVDLPEVEVPVDDTPSNVFFRWHEKNTWYKLKGPHEASRYADVLGATYREENPKASEEKVLAHVEKQVARRFPELFENENARRVPEVNTHSSTKQGEDTFKLTEEEERAFKLFVEQGAPLTRKQYVDEIKKVRGA